MAKSKKSDSKKSTKEKEIKSLKAEKPIKEKKEKKKEKAVKAAPISAPAPAPIAVKKAVKPKKATSPEIVITTEEISLRAYYIAERRQAMGWPGDSSNDWTEAERQLKAEVKKKAGL